MSKAFGVYFTSIGGRSTIILRMLDMLLAIVKFNGGRGALLCNGCHIILDTGFNHQDQEHFCEHCATGRRRVYTRPGVRRSGDQARSNLCGGRY